MSALDALLLDPDCLEESSPPAVAPSDTPDWDATLFEGLNPNQHTAVMTTEGPLLVLAGAGSGKTRVLVTRIAHLVKHLGVDPAHVCAITFTKKAATEMRERLERTLGREQAERVTLSTFHALGVTLLREYGVLIGVGGKFGIADEQDVAHRLRSILKGLGIARNAEGERPIDVQQRIGLAKAAFADLAARQALTDPESVKDLVARFRAGDPDVWARIAGALDAPDLERFQAVYATYQAQLAADQLVDYDDLIALPLLLFVERDDVRRLATERWRYFLVDEYQDTDYTQDHLLRLLAGDRRNLCVVGDDDQAIYGWRRAKVENIRTFPDRFAPCSVVTLDENYRSTPVILEAANASLAARPEPGRLPKRLWTAASGGAPVRVWTCMTQEAEAYAIAADIRQAIDTGEVQRYEDILVLYRMNALARPVEEAFRRSGIPYRIINGLALHDRKEVRDTLAYLKAAANWHDIASFERALTAPARGVGPATVEALAGYARASGISIVEAVRQPEQIAGIKPKQAAVLQAFGAFIEDLTARDTRDGVAAVLQYVYEQVGTRQALIEELAQLEAEDDDVEAKTCLRRIHDLEDFALYVEEYDRVVAERQRGRAGNGHATIADLLEELALFAPDTHVGSTPVEGEAPDAAEQPRLGAVTCMSVHAAKGLEAERVYVIGLEEQVFPKQAFGAPVVSGVIPTTVDEETAEEGRLFYVAITRAKQQLILSASRTRELQRGDVRPMIRSRFLASIPETIFRHEQVR